MMSNAVGLRHFLKYMSLPSPLTHPAELDTLGADVDAIGERVLVSVARVVDPGQVEEGLADAAPLDLHAAVLTLVGRAPPVHRHWGSQTGQAH